MVVLRGPRGYGKTTAIVRWLEQEWDALPTAYIALDARARTETGFWRTLRAGLIAAGCTDRSADQAQGEREAALALLDRHDEQWRLVLDDYHQVGVDDGTADQIDADLLERLRVNRGLEVVVATRTLRRLETVGALSVDLTVLRPSDLALRPEGLVALAESRGVPMTMDRAQHLVSELGGWPAALRAMIDDAAISARAPVVDSHMVDEFLYALLQDLRSEDLREFMLRAAVPTEFSAAGAQAILPGAPVGEHLRELRLTELLSERNTVGGTRYSYPPAIRESILRIIHERQPSLIYEVNRALLPLVAAQDGPIGVLRHAVAGREWGIALQVMEEEWAALVGQHPQSLAKAARQFPSEFGANEARLRVIHGHLHHMESPPGATRTTWEPADAPFVDAAVRQRLRETGGVPDELLVLLQTALAAVFSGENDAAIYAFTSAWEQGIAAGDRDASLLGAAGALMAQALHGQTRQALEAAADTELAEVIAGRGQDDISRLARMVGRTGRAVAAVDSMSPDVHEVVAAMREPVHRNELWGLVVSTRGLYASVYGSPEEQARMTGYLRAALRHMEPGGITETTVRTQLVELLVAGGLTDVAAQAAEQLPDNFVTYTTQAYLLLAQGRDSQAIEVAEQGIADPRTTGRTRLLGELVITSALYRLRQSGAARRRYARAVRIAHETGQRRPFAMVDSEVLDALAGSDAALLVSRPEPSTVIGPASSQPVSMLSARERQVLEALHHHPGATSIAAELDMSVNTAKTHLRNVYRKLGATSRAEALTLSADLMSGSPAPEGPLPRRPQTATQRPSPVRNLTAEHQ